MGLGNPGVGKLGRVKDIRLARMIGDREPAVISLFCGGGGKEWTFYFGL